MKVEYKATDLTAMSSKERERALARLVEGTRGIPNGELHDVRSEIATFEKRFGLGSDAMRQEVATGQRREDLDTCRWLMLLNRRTRLEKRLESIQTRP